MKCLLVGVLGILLVVPMGCVSGTRGGPGATDPNAKQPYYGQSDNTFNLSMPSPATTLKQGETRAATIGIRRGTNFDQKVTVHFASMPTGVSVAPASPVIDRGQTEAKIVFTAATDASLGHFTVLVTGHPTEGADSSNEINITVDKR